MYDEDIYDELTVEEARTLEAVLKYETKSGAAKALGIDRSTLYRRLMSPSMRAAMKAVRDESLSAATNRLQSGAERVVNVLLQVAEDKNAPSSARVAAANHFLTYAYKAAELEDVTAQIEEIKQALR